MTSTDSNLSVQETLQRALSAFEASDSARAVELAKTAISLLDRKSGEAKNLSPQQHLIQLADAWHLRGVAEHRAGQSDAGARSLARAIELCPDRVDFRVNLGKLLRDTERTDEAFIAFEEAAKHGPDHAAAQFNYGQALNKRDQFTAALTPLRRATELNPKYISAWNSLGNALSKLKRSAEAADAYSHVPADHSLAASSLMGRAKSLKDAERFDDAIALLATQPNLAGRPSIVTTLVDIYAHVGRNQDAYDLGKQCLDYLRDHPDAAIDDERGVHGDDCEEKGQERIAALHHILSTVCQRLHRFEDADEHLAEMSKFMPDSNKSKLSKGIFDYRMGDFVSARRAFEELLADDPDHKEACSNLSLIDLAEGKFDPGWERYKSRFQSTAAWNENTRRLTRPRWDGEPLNGKTILLVSEQGMGDTIQFIRYAAAIKATYDCKVCFCGPQNILALLVGVAGIDRLFSSVDPHESYDCWAPLLDLPHLLGHYRCDDFPASIPVMKAEPQRVREWGHRIQTLVSASGRSTDSGDSTAFERSMNRRLRIGIAWQGSKRHVGDAFRSFPLEMFQPIANLPGVELFSLQLGAGTEQIDEVKSTWPIHVLGDDFDAGEDAFLDAAAVMANLDLFIGCDSSLIHLAGSIGLPAWVALSTVPDWRWMTDRDDSPWYPPIENGQIAESGKIAKSGEIATGPAMGMKLWRQEKLGRWTDVFAAMASSINESTRQTLLSQRDARVAQSIGGPSSGGPLLGRSGESVTPSQTIRQAVALHQSGKLDDALIQYETVLNGNPAHPDALQLAGLIDSVQGRHGLATWRIATAVAMRPKQATFLGNFAQHLRTIGQPELAIRNLQAACQLAPNEDSHFQELITLLQQLGRHDEAAKQHAARADRGGSPDQTAGSFRAAATAAIRAGQDQQAIDCLQKALAIEPDNLKDWLRLGNLWFNQADDGQAIAAFDRAIAIDPNSVDALANRGVCHWRKNDSAAAESDYQRTLEIDPDHANTLVNYGIMLRSQNRLVEADQMVNRGYELNPDSESAQVQFAASLRNAGRLDEAMSVLKEARQTRPTLPVLNGIGTIHLISGDMIAARETFLAAAKFDPDHPSVTLNIAILDLLEGNFRDGLPAYEIRRKVARMSGVTTGTPAWDGSPSLDGKTILLINEQGWGDTFHFVRYAEVLKQRFDCQVHLAVRRPLLALAGSWPHIDRVFPLDSVDQSFDFWAYLMSMPLLLEQFDESDFPSTIPYLASDKDRDQRWEQWLETIPGRKRNEQANRPASTENKRSARPDGIRIGIAWQGSRANARDSMRSFSLSQFSPIAAIEGVTLVSLQSGDGEEQIDDDQLGFRVFRPADFVPASYEVDADGAFIDAASIIKNLDLVISCDSAICHLAAGLGIPTWIGLSRVPDWRWMLTRRDSPWYPDVTLFRQPTNGDWNSVFDQMMTSLSAVMKGQISLDQPVLGQPVLGAMPGPLAQTQPNSSTTSVPSSQTANKPSSRQPPIGGPPSVPTSHANAPIDLGEFNRMLPSRHGWLIYNRHDAYIGRSIEQLGEFSEAEVELFEQLIQPGNVVVEAGSNIGSHTLPLAKLVGKTGRVYAFEPQRMVHQTLSANIAANSLTNVESRWAGLGHTAGHLDVPELNFATANNFGGLSLGSRASGDGKSTDAKSAGGTERKKQVTTRVSLITLDSLNLKSLRLLKADVEGMEEDVLRGAVETIARCRPALYLENDRKDKKESLQAFVKSLGYRMFDHIVPLYRPNNHFGCSDNPFGNIHSWNLLALPSEFDLNITGLREVS